MIGAFGEVYVLDWGIAVSLREDPSGRLPTVATATDIAGTPAYMAPEMLLGDPFRLSPRTDVYLLGAILYEMFAGSLRTTETACRQSCPACCSRIRRSPRACPRRPDASASAR